MLATDHLDTSLRVQMMQQQPYPMTGRFQSSSKETEEEGGMALGSRLNITVSIRRPQDDDPYSKSESGVIPPDGL